MDTARYEPLLGVGRDGVVRWSTPRAAELGLVDDGHAGPDAQRLVGRMTQRATSGTLGTLAALRAGDGRPWIVGFDAVAEPMVLTGTRLHTPGEVDLSAPLVAAIGFQVSHALRSPLAQLAGHHLLAGRAMDRGDLDGARQELATAQSLGDRLLSDADRTTDCVGRLLARDLRAPCARDTFADAIQAALAVHPEPAATGRLGLVGAGRLTAVIDVPTPDLDLAAGVAAVASYLTTAWVIDTLELRVGGTSLVTLVGVASDDMATRTFARDELVEQAFTIGRSIAQSAPIPPVVFASELGVLLAAGGRISLVVERDLDEQTDGGEHHRLLVALARASAAVLL